MASQLTARKQQGEYGSIFYDFVVGRCVLDNSLTEAELQNQYSNYKSALQQIAQKIGDVEQEAEEHK